MTIFSKSNLFKITTLFLLWMVMVFAFRECRRVNKKFDVGGDTVTVRTSDTTYLPGDSIPKEIKVAVTVPVYIDRPIPADVDTAAILRDYFALKIYNTVIEDSLIKSFLRDSISQNKIVGRKFEYQLKRGPMVITNTTTNTVTLPQKTKLFVGLELEGNTTAQSASANIQLLTKRDHGYTIGYNPFDKKVSAGVYFKIKLHK